jgi:tetratricopeptide (TPR) repeat protein
MLCVIAFLFSAITLLSATSAAAQSVKGEASVTVSGGYGRLMIRLAKEVEAQVRLSSGILVVQFKEPVDIPMDRITVGATGYIGAARRDPDGRALRFALAQKVRISSMNAGERLYIDLLPESWTAEPPGIPRDVVEDLAQRARDAERIARQRIMAEQLSKAPPVRVRIATQPTFTRYIFDLPELTGVTTDRGKDILTLSFSALLRFDLAEAKLALPAVVGAIVSEDKGQTSTVRFDFSRPVDVRTFREDSNFVVDVNPLETSPARAVAGIPIMDVGVPATVPQASVVERVETAPSADVVPGKDAEDKPVIEAPRQPPIVADRAEMPVTAPILSGGPGRGVIAELRRQGDNLRLSFPFVAPTPAAVFQRADTLWLVFDTPAEVDIRALENEQSKVIRSANVSREGASQVIRLKLERPRLISVAAEQSSWSVSIGDVGHGTAKPLSIARNIVGPGRTSITIPFDDPRQMHWLADPDIGDKLLVVTGLGPARGLMRGQDFVELRALATAQGIAIQSYADDLKAELSVDKVLLIRPGGLTLSELEQAKLQETSPAVTFDTSLWNVDRSASLAKRESELLRAAAEAPFTKRTMHRMNLARFYFSRQLFAEAKAVLDTVIADDRPTADDPAPLVMRAIANIMLNRPDIALKDLANPVVGNQNDAQLWRALVHAQGGKWAQARDAFRNVEGALSALPLELQRVALKEALRAAIEVGDFPNATDRLNDFATIGISPEFAPLVSVLAGRLAEGVGRIQDALAAYRGPAESDHRPAAAQARLRELALRYTIGDITRTDLITELEFLVTSWRGDETEVEALQILARLYAEEQRYRDAFHIMRVALRAHPNSAATRSIHEAAAKTFDALFLAGKADTLPAIDALSLFYDFRDLTPIGRRGDEIIRRLADRLVSVDLLDQAAELLQYQVDNRLQGAARAQVASRLAVVYLLNHKPDKAQATLRATRTADLSNELRIPRLLIEARALSDIGRHEFALDVIAGIEGRESLRLRSDIYWAARRWQQAAEHIELLHGDRWKSFEPLSDAERFDILRAGVGYSLAEDKIGIARLRDKYAAKMSEGPDRNAFGVVTGGLGQNSNEFREVARIVGSGDTLTGFLRDLKARYPEMHSVVPDTSGPPASDGSMSPKIDPKSTGSVPRSMPRRVSAR